MGEEFLNKY